MSRPAVFTGQWGIRLVTVIGLGICSTSGAWAQNEAAIVSETLRQAIVTPDTALLPLPPEVVCGPQVDFVSVSPRQEYALIARRSTYPARTAGEFLARRNKSTPADQIQEAGSPEVQLLLWGPGSRRATTLWHHTLGATTGYAEIAVFNIDWMGGTDTALVMATVAPGPISPEAAGKFGRLDGPKTKTVILRINAAKGTAETVATLEGNDVRLITSRNQPVTVVSTGVMIAGQRTLKMLRIGASGPATELPAISLSNDFPESVTWQFFLPDGRLLGSHRQQGTDGKAASRNITMNVMTGAVQDYDKPETPKWPGYVPPLPLAYKVVKATNALTYQDNSATVAPLWIEGTDPKTSGRGLISPDSDPTESAYPLTSAVLYPRQGTLYATPLVTMPLAEFQAQRREQYEKDTLERAHMIGNIADGLASSQGEQLPPPGEFAKIIQDQYRSDLLFRNPATNKPGFTAAYTDTNIKAIKDPSKVVIGYLEGPGGRAIIYYGGTTKWEDTPNR